MKLKKLAQALSVLCIATPAAAQQAVNVERIEITGSSIKRIQEEGALPVQVITRQEIERRGIVSAEQLMSLITANGTGADNLSSNVGIQLGTTDRNNNGNTSANLRGLGASSTLVLLNGRRIAVHGAKGNAVDLNSIPLATVERVEILKDGASAIYGTDAIGGVVNFILRKDYQGVEISAATDITEDGGGNIHRGAISAGWGSLAKDRWNVMGSIMYDKQEILRGDQRDFHNGYQPDRGLSPDTVGAPFATLRIQAGSALPANFTLPATGTQQYTRANLLSFQGNCGAGGSDMSQYGYILWGSPGFRYACAWDYGGSEVIIQPVERTQFVGRGSFAINNETTAFAEIVGSRTQARKSFEPIQITSTGSTANMMYPANGPYYVDLSQYIPSFDRTKPEAYSWRCTSCGNREIETTTDAYRMLFGIEGLIGKWDYKLGLSESGSKAQSILASGYMFTPLLTTAMASGQVNPFLLAGQSQSAAGAALLNAARADGAKEFDGESRLTAFDGAISGELWQLPAGPMAAAFGFDYRKETYKFDDGSRFILPVFLAPFDPDFAKVSRTVKAIYGEVAVPIIQGLEATLAVRYDNYSDFGSTTNPKVSFKWHPIAPLMFRGSYNEGFRAPSFFQLYTATSESQIPGNISDPVLCPLRPNDLSVCAIRPNSRQGGNPDLQPETSKQWSVGFLVEPAQWMSASVDAWQVHRYDHIYELTPQQVVANYQTFPENLVRGANGLLTDPGAYIRAGFVNAADDITRGVDVSLRFNWRWEGKWTAGLDGTYIDSYRGRIFAGDPYVELVGQWSARDLYVRWKHIANIGYENGPWSATLYQRYTDGYKDQVPAGTVPPGFNPDVDSYITYDTFVTYTGFKNLTLTFGVKNLLNEDPPFTAHNVDFTPGAGWDPRVADPRGRSYIARLTYKF